MNTPIIDGSIIEAELAFYPSMIPHRAFIKKQNTLNNTVKVQPKALVSWSQYEAMKVDQLKLNPWRNNRSNLIRDIRVIKQGNKLIAIDTDNVYKKLSSSFEGNKKSTFLLMSHNEYITLAFVDMSNGIYPIGILQDKRYFPL